MLEHLVDAAVVLLDAAVVLLDAGELHREGMDARVEEHMPVTYWCSPAIELGSKPRPI